MSHVSRVTQALPEAHHRLELIIPEVQMPSPLKADDPYLVAQGASLYPTFGTRNMTEVLVAEDSPEIQDEENTSELYFLRKSTHSCEVIGEKFARMSLRMTWFC